MKKTCVVLTGAGISQESGIRTFRDGDGLWENHRIEDVATPQAFAKDPEKVLRFYNQRRRQLQDVTPNLAHMALAQWEKEHAETWDLHVITQNVDDLHERAGSKNILHLHGELKKVRSTKNPNHILGWENDLQMTDRGPDGSALRPHIVWFGEEVPAMREAESICATADAWMVVGTSLVVYPAAGLIHHMPSHAPGWLVDPSPAIQATRQITIIEALATAGVPQALAQLTRHFHGA
jgi:NAD-dependent deacetylase